jgi:hypothetical protein
MGVGGVTGDQVTPVLARRARESNYRLKLWAVFVACAQ